MSIDPRNGSWDKELETGLPDCRVRPFERENHQVQIGRRKWDIVFCAQCHKPYGATPPSAPFIFYICDACVRENPPPVEIMQLRIPGT
jgi:hypothetical protein